MYIYMCMPNLSAASRAAWSSFININKCIYVCVCVYIHTYIHTYIYIYTHTYIYI